jgi:hypothetical protein
VSVETDDQTGAILAVYLRMRNGRVADTREHAEGAVFADYDRHGRLLGNQVLVPCKTQVLDRISKDSSAKRFVTKSLPRGMLVEA